MDYRSSGVDIEAGNEVVRRIRGLAKATFTPGVLSEIGSFGGLFDPDPGGSGPVLVASADGVGTKLKVAFLTGRHDTVGEDLVNHCVNDILVQGARPLFFLDYLATGRLEPSVAVSIVEGIARGCSANRCALLGGETAEMPGFYAPGEYDLAGFIVGAVPRGAVIDGRGIAPGDVFLGLPSAGLHTNGYSLARRIVFDGVGLTVDSRVPELACTVGDALLATHRSYLPVLGPILEGARTRPMVKGLAHITGGGITDNLPRILPEGIRARIRPTSWQVPALFRFLRRAGDVSDADMRRTFNMGIGMVVACGRGDAEELLAALSDAGEPGAVIIGQAVSGTREVEYDQ